jgi:hypothetical protein
MNNAIKNAEPDQKPTFAFPSNSFYPQFAAIIIVIVAAAVAAAAKQLLETAMAGLGRGRYASGIIVTQPGAIQILGKMGMKSANVNGVLRLLPVAMAGRM